VPCHQLKVGDRLLSESGAWVTVEVVEDTGIWSTVYNLRVAEYHTYFVGCDEWGFSVWAHNTVCTSEEARALRQIANDPNTPFEAWLSARERVAEYELAQQQIRRAEVTKKYFDALEKKSGQFISLKSQQELIEAVQKSRFYVIQYLKTYFPRESQAKTWYNLLLKMLEDREQPFSAEWHHLMTIENLKAGAEGGPYTPLFEALAERRGWPLDENGSRLNHTDNLLYLEWHQGPHARLNRVVYEMMRNATDGKTGPAYNAAFDATLKIVRDQTAKRGTLLNKLATGL
jgi:hypothetical protein